MRLLFLEGFGTWELLFIMFAVLVLFGAKSIPSIAKTLGRGMREIRQASDEIKRDIARSASEMRQDMNIDRHIESFSKPMKDIEESILKEPGKSSEKKAIDRPTEQTGQTEQKTVEE